jgi:hypothetical protein
MIISHRHKFIFIKNRKVGSTSTELALQKICGPEDILTPDGVHPKKGDVLLPRARNYEGRFWPFREIMQDRHPLAAARTLRDLWERPRFYNHIRASSVRARIPRDIWDSYYKFCFDRNPWDKMISFYYWFGRRGSLPPFNEYVRNRRQFGTDDQTLPSDWSRYTLHDEIIVDDVFDFRDLSGGLNAALSRAGVAPEIIEQVILAKEKTEVRKSRKIEFDPDVDAIIRRAFAREIATLPFCAEPQLD